MKSFTIALAIVTALTACATEPNAVVPPVQADATRPHRIFVIAHDWHTGIALPTDALADELPFLRARFKGAPYIEFGWGDKGFYQAAEITAGLTLQALFWSPGTVMHVVAVPRPPQEYFPYSKVIALCIGDAEMKTLKQFLQSSFRRDTNGNVQPLRNGIYGDSQFYAANGRFHLFNTCNKWTAKALQSGGVDISPTLKLTAASVTGHLQSIGRALMISESGFATYPLGAAALCGVR